MFLNNRNTTFAYKALFCCTISTVLERKSEYWLLRDFIQIGNKPKEFCELLGELRILCDFTNILHQDTTIPSFLPLDSYCYIIAFYLLISYGSSISSVHFILFLVGAKFQIRSFFFSRKTCMELIVGV